MESGARSSGKKASSLIFSRDIAAYHPNTLHKAAAASMAFFFTCDKKNANQRSAMVWGIDCNRWFLNRREQCRFPSGTGI
jgi:hypothetical protein